MRPGLTLTNATSVKELLDVVADYYRYDMAPEDLPDSRTELYARGLLHIDLQCLRQAAWDIMCDHERADFMPSIAEWKAASGRHLERVERQRIGVRQLTHREEPLTRESMREYLELEAAGGECQEWAQELLAHLDVMGKFKRKEPLDMEGRMSELEEELAAKIDAMTPEERAEHEARIAATHRVGETAAELGIQACDYCGRMWRAGAPESEHDTRPLLAYRGPSPYRKLVNLCEDCAPQHEWSRGSKRPHEQAARSPRGSDHDRRHPVLTKRKTR